MALADGFLTRLYLQARTSIGARPSSGRAGGRWPRHGAKMFGAMADYIDAPAGHTEHCP